MAIKIALLSIFVILILIILFMVVFVSNFKISKFKISKFKIPEFNTSADNDIPYNYTPVILTANDFEELPNNDWILETYNGTDSDTSAIAFSTLYKSPLVAGIKKAENNIWDEVKNKIKSIIQSPNSFDRYLLDTKNEMDISLNSIVYTTTSELASKYLLAGISYKIFRFDTAFYRHNYDRIEASTDLSKAYGFQFVKPR
jgi:hypothetical protein